MRETASLLAAPVDRKERIFPILCKWQSKTRHKYLICASMDSISAKQKPRLLTDRENGISQPEMDIGARLGMTWLNLDLVPMATSPPLSSFIFNLLSPIQYFFPPLVAITEHLYFRDRSAEKVSGATSLRQMLQITLDILSNHSTLTQAN